MTASSLADHLTQVSQGMRARARPPMMKPQVGVNRLTKPLAATLIMIEVSTDQPMPATMGETMGEDRPARPEEDGTRKLSPTWST